MTILEKIALALPAVESPARYMGGEANSVVKDHSQMLCRMAFVFPDKYEIGMSNNGPVGRHGEGNGKVRHSAVQLRKLHAGA